MGIIRVLPEAIANKIAAGEVIERPASVVKELVENALDAGATVIEIEIAHGGKSLIRVADNGAGMGREDAELAFARHATSKLAHVEDLWRLTSLGFRGEALPSIAAVSRLRLATARPDDESGTEVRIEGGRPVSVGPCAPRRGTVVEVRDLFFNTPARRKFVRSDATELGHVVDGISNLAFAHLGVRFALTGGPSTLLDVLPTDRARTRAAGLLGEEMARQCLELDGRTGGTRVRGLIGTPAIARANRSGQRWFVNRRWVRALSLSYALQDGYYGLLMHGRFPTALIFLEIDPQRVDVNVHPTKQEVRLSNEADVKTFLRDLVSQRLRQEPSLAPRLAPSTARATSIAGQDPAGPAAPLLADVAPAGRLFTLREPPRLYAASSPEPQPIPLREGLKVTRLLGQVHQTYLVAETEEGMLVIDQHAAHERVMFEALSANLRAAQVERQPLLMDAVLELHPREVERFTAALPLLSRIGFEIEPFGERAYVIRACPAILGDQDPVTFLRTALDQQEEGAMRTAVETRTDTLAAFIACKRRSVRAHDSMAPEAASALVRRLARCENPFTCPHGRPTILTLTAADLARQFKRT